MKLESEEVRKVAEILRAMSNETRLSILCLLSEKPLTVNELTEAIHSGNHSAISQHLKKLRDMNWVRCERQGQHMRYFLVEGEILHLMKDLKEHFCGGNDEQ